MNKIIILGGCGYLGSKLFLHLKDNYEVSTVDLEWFGNYVNPNNLKIDFRYLDKNFFSDFDVVILLAGHSSVPMCANDRLSSFKNNVENFIYLTEKLDKQKFIYASSSSVYGNIGAIEAKEDSEFFKPKTFYDLNKKEIDCYMDISNLNYYALRFGTINGYSPNLRIDIMINKMFEDAKSKGKIEIYNPNISRPILGIDDCCNAIEYIIKNKSNKGIYNLASFNAKVIDIANSCKKYIKDVEIILKGEAPSYDFGIDTTKFKITYDFEFKETVETIISKLLNSKYRTSTRNGINYGSKYV